MSTNHLDDLEIRGILGDLYLGSYRVDAGDRRELIRRATATPQRPAWTFIGRWLPLDALGLDRLRLRSPSRRSLALVVVLGLLLAAVAGIYVGSRPSLPEPFGPASNGMVVMASGGDIYTVDPETGLNRRIVTGPTWDGEPRWSRDGTRLAFLRRLPSGAVSIAAVRADGSDLVVSPELITDIDSDGIAWSPDGRTVAFVSGGPPPRIYLFDAIDGSTRALEGTGYLSLQVLWRPPDGRELLYYGRQGGEEGLFLVSVADGSIRRLPTLAGSRLEYRPTGWLPDGSRFVFHDARVTEVVDAATGVRTVLPILFGQPSNDGTMVVGFSDDLFEPRPCVMPIEGGTCVELQHRLALPHGTTHMGLQWLPDDQWILSLSNDGAAELLDPGGGPPSAPPWLLAGSETIQRLAP